MRMIIIVMGVAGAGKTTIGRSLAAALRWRFCDADTFHSAANIDKLRRGLPLTDEDRAPWLAEIHAAMGRWIQRGEPVVLACSLLKASYRDRVLTGYRDQTKLVYLKAGPRLLQQRLVHRTGHFMGDALLASQLATLEEPSDALTVDAGQTPDDIVAQIRSGFNL